MFNSLQQIPKKKIEMEYYDEVIEVKKKTKAGEKSVEKLKETKMINDDDIERTTTKRPASSLPRKSARKPDQDQHERHASSESDSSESDANDNAKVPAEGFDYKQWEHLALPNEIKEMFQYIGR